MTRKRGKLAGRRASVQTFMPPFDELSAEVRMAFEGLSEETRNLLIRQIDLAYLAAMIDLKGVESTKVQLSFGSSAMDAEALFRKIQRTFVVTGMISTAHLENAPYFIDMANEYKDPHKNPTRYFKIKDPAEVLRVAEACLPYSERKQRLEQLIEAAKHLLAKREREEA